MGRAFHDDSRTWSNFAPSELVKLCGVQAPQWPYYALKELIDNSLAAMEEHACPSPSVWVSISSGPNGGRMSVSDSGPGLTDQILDRVLDFDRFGGSNRHHKLPTRGAQGNALMTIFGIITAWSAGAAFLTISRPDGTTVVVEITLDTVKQKVNVSRMVNQTPGSRSGITLTLPPLPWKRYGTTVDDLTSMVQLMARLNPHVNFMLNVNGSSVMVPASQESDGALDGLSECGAVMWFTASEFSARLAADARARPGMLLDHWKREFRWAKYPKSAFGLITLDEVCDGISEKEFNDVSAKVMRDIVEHTNLDKAADPKQLVPVGKESLHDYIVNELGADPTTQLEYEVRAGSFQLNEATVPYLVEVVVGQMPAKSHTAPAPILAMNRTVLYGSPTFRPIKWREKVLGDWRELHGDLGALCTAYHVTDGTTPCAVLVHVTCPSPGYSGYGKQQFNTTWLSEPLADAMEKATRKVRRIRAGEARRTVGPSTDESIRDTLFGILPGVYDKATNGGKLPIMLRQLYYSCRKVWHLHHHKELQYGTYCAYLDEYEEKHAGRQICLRDPRGTLIEPHSGRSLRLGTDEVSRYEPKKWEGHTIIFVEKEGFAHVLRDYGITKRYDAIVIGSKGFAVEAGRDVLQKYKRLLGGMVKIVVLHDADPAGYMIGYDLANNLPRFTENVDIQVIDAGLRIEDAQRMGLQSEPFELVKSNWRMVHNMRRLTLTDPDGTVRPLLENEAWESFMPSHMRHYSSFPDHLDKSKCSGFRVELNAMDPPEFIPWLENILDSNGCKKVRPPDDIVGEVASNARRNLVKSTVGGALMRMLGDEVVESLVRRIGVPEVDLDALLAKKPEQSWHYITEAAARSGVDIDAIVEDELRRKLSGIGGGR